MGYNNFRGVIRITPVLEAGPLMNRTFGWEVSTGEMKVTQRNKQENKETELERKRECVCVCVCVCACPSLVA